MHLVDMFNPTLPQTPPPLSVAPILSTSLAQNLDVDRSPPATPTNTGALLTSSRIRAISPPTPAPSPQPQLSSTRFPLSYEWSPPTRPHHLSQEAADDFLVDTIRAQFGSMPPALRQRLLAALIADTPPSSLSPLVSLITPRLKRDFLKTLPVELAFHVLSFVDDVRTLARASGVSRFWRALLEDEGTWKRMCWNSGFGDAEGEQRRSAGMKIRGMEFGEREVEEGTPAGRERRGTLDREGLSEFAARAEMFGLRMDGEEKKVEEMEVDDEREVGSGTRSWTLQPTTQNVQMRDASEEFSWGAGGLGFDSDFSALENPASATLNTRRRLYAQPSTSHRDPGSTSPTTPAAAAAASFLLPASLSPRRARPRSLPPPSIDDPVPPFPPSSPVLHSLSASLPASSYPPPPDHKPFSYKTHFKRAYLTESSWLRGPGRLLSTQMSADDGVVTSLGFDSEWIVVGMATSKVHVFEAATGSYVKTLDGHELGVWCLTLVSKSAKSPDEDKGKGKGKPSRRPRRSEGDSTTVPPALRRRSSLGSLGDVPPAVPAGIKVGGMGLGAGGETGDSSQQAGVCGTATGWGQEGAIVVSGGCDRDVRVWDVETGECLHVLRGHTSTVRCMRVIDGRPIAVSGSRDATLRVWNIETGTAMHLLAGHQHSVRCIEVSGNKVVSGSYDATCRLWDVDTGECLFVFRGHEHQIYAVAFDGIRVATGSLDSTVRIWSATTGEFLALLQGHTSLVGQLQLDPISNTLVTGGSDGRVIVFDLTTFETKHRLCAHDNSVTCLQFDDRFIVTGGNDGRIKLWDFKTGAFIRELAEPCDAVWRVTFRDDKCVILCRREGKTLMEVRTFRPSELELHGDGAEA